jgi:hypothetical protein
MTPNQLKRNAAPIVTHFSVGRPPFGTTLARQITKQHLTNFNNVFWVSEHSFRLVRQSFDKIKQPTPGPGVHGTFENDSAWKGGVDEFRIWARQHVLISAASLLEVYIQSAATAALSATPELIDRSLTGVHGFNFIKHPEKAPPRLKTMVSDRAKSMTHGLWNERLSMMSQVFGKLPPALLALSKDLQGVQDRRNRIAHSYGFGGELRKTPWEPIQAIQVSPSQLVAAIKLVSSAIRLADEEVFGPHIGAYEILHEYHVWLTNNKNAHHLKVSGWLQPEFRNHIGRAFGQSPGANYIKQMIAHYDSIV